jgi:hypothetical protein
MRYCEISKEMSSLYFALESQNLTQCSVYSVHCTGGEGDCVSNSGTLALNRQNTASPKYNDDISLLISQYLISD